MRETTLQGINYLETTDTSAVAKKIGTLFKLPKTIDQLGERIARKLNEANYTISGFEQINIIFNSNKTPGLMTIMQDNTDTSAKSIEIGLSVDSINKLSEKELEMMISNFTFQALELISKTNKANLRILSSVNEYIQKFGDNSEIFIKKKESDRYLVELSYKVSPHGGNSLLLIKVFDKELNKSYRGDVLEIIAVEDVKYLINELSIFNEEIIIKPKQSNTAHLAKLYKMPIIVDITKLEEIKA